MKHIAPEKFLELLDKPEMLKGIRIVDVREPYEWDHYHLNEPELIPMNTIPERLDELVGDADLYVLCAHGVRSEMVCGYLERNGFDPDKLVNVEGGMAALAMLRGFAYD
ncbi:rhodanese-like domain-containing protein [Paenibacillus chitinolyticus]|uniref:rhodanese-like domain-containing protein n=1 Tax=Paenibacillus chitinolyticus TaxID=79263 RepID=UPI001C4778F9|nr:rhodanese-like domain-containing protein [Paenibacillus chitinolyticus]MBV6714606.1 rhodanese-like domain-containing protein [Paenibacillus chitinolyticus]